MNLNQSKILIVRLSSFGDIVLTFSLIDFLKKEFRDTELHFLTNSEYESLLKENRLIDKILIFQNSISKTRKMISREKYDIIFDLHKNFKSILSTTCTEAKTLRYKKENLKKFLLVNFKINLFRNITPVYLKYFKILGKTDIKSEYKFTTTKLVENERAELKENHILIAPSSKHYTKRYPAKKFNLIIKKLNKHKIVLTGDKSVTDNKICNFLKQENPEVENLCGKTDFKALIELVTSSKLVITNDNGVMHLAEALGRKIIAIFGSSVEEFGFYPQLETSSILEIKELKCRPCSHIGRQNCPKKHFECMEKIEPVEIIKLIEEKLN
ncbi:MAG: glycosyltransferase family 9 protein [Ignavibacteria bacterium]|nr:glycosyltransferase family 9 protein [Ignavibacteria bacterium]